MVPVLDSQKQPLMPCTEKRARKLMEKGEAKPFWKQGIFCIILQREPSERNVQPVCVAIDPGSKRTGITVATETKVVCNMLFNAPGWVKKHMEFRATMRGSRRSRKTPYRQCRFNRNINQDWWIPPSTKSRWQAHIRIINVWRKLVPVSDVVIEDIKARSIKGSDQRNRNFSPLEQGKKWFNYEIVKMGNMSLTKFRGYETKSQRDYRGFSKTKEKLKDIWEAHNVDSHCLAEMLYGDIKPYKGFIRCDFIQWHRRQLHVSNPVKGGVRRMYGGTRSMGLNRGTLVRHHKHGLTYVGGTSNGRISLHKLDTGKRVAENAKQGDLQVLTNLKYRGSLSIGRLKETVYRGDL